MHTGVASASSPNNDHKLPDSHGNPGSKPDTKPVTGGDTKLESIPDTNAPPHFNGGAPFIQSRPMIVNGEPVDGSDYPWMVSLRAVFPGYIFNVVDASRCEWIRNNDNTYGEEYVGYVYSAEECVELVHDYCPWANVANVYEGVFDPSGSRCDHDGGALFGGFQ